MKLIIIPSKVFFLFIGREPTKWPANNYLQIMVCSCAMWSNCVWLQIIFWSCVKETTLFSFFRSLLRENGSFPNIFIKKQTRWVNDKTIITRKVLHFRLSLVSKVRVFGTRKWPNVLVHLFGGRDVMWKTLYTGFWRIRLGIWANRKFWMNNNYS